MALFTGVRFWISTTFPEKRRNNLGYVLESSGGIPSSLDQATHVITDSLVFEGYRSIQIEGWEGSVHDPLKVHAVSDKWVDSCMLHNQRRNEKYYSADPAKIFSGVVACSTEVPPADVEVMSAAIEGLGGQWRSSLTREATHLFALSPGSDKYKTATHWRATTGLKIVVPHWFDDSVRLAIPNLPAEEYEFPEPRILRPRDHEHSKTGKDTDSDKKALYRTQMMTVDDVRLGNKNIWNGKKILLSLSLDIPQSRRAAVEAEILRAHGAIVRYEQNGGMGNRAEEIQLVDQTDVLITRFRKGNAFKRALETHKTVGTTAWLFYVHCTGTITRPTDKLMHFPVYKQPIPGFEAHQISVSNYTGESRDYLKKLITVMGGEFTPSMTGKNTVLVAAYLAGSKVEKARNWSIPVVSHIWLEDCFREWRALTVGIEKYIVFPPMVDFSQMMGNRGMDANTLDIDGGDEIEAESEADDKPAPSTRKKKKPIRSAQTIIDEDMAPSSSRARNSVGDAKEAADALTLSLDDDDDFPMEDVTNDNDPMDVDQRPSRSRSRKPIASTSRQTRSESRRVAEEAQEERRSRSRARRTPASTTRRTRSETRKEENEAGSSRLRRGRSASRASSTGRGAGVEDEEEENVLKTPHRGRSNRTATGNGALNGKNKNSMSQVAETPAKWASSSRRRRSSPPPPAPADDEMVDDDMAPLGSTKGAEKESAPSKVHRSKVKIDVRALRNKSPEDSDTEPEEEELDIQPLKPKLRTLGKTVSVVIPLRKTPKNRGKEASSSSASGPPMKKSSKTTVAAEGPSTKRGRPAAARDPSPPPTSSSAPITGASDGRAKRGAATKAASKLAENATDMNKWEEEKKRAKARGSVGGKRRASDVYGMDDEEDEEPEEDQEPEPKKRKVVKGKGKKSQEEDEEDEDEEERPPKALVRSKSRRQSQEDGEADSPAKGARRDIRLLTTQVNITDEMKSSLAKIGIKMTTSPMDCTHVVAGGLVRTEKMLCAMACAPFILKEEWAIKCAAQRKVLSEDAFTLNDPVNEKKYGVKLADALSRAHKFKKAGQGVFTGHTFYVTPKAEADQKLLKTVIHTHGGAFKASTSTITPRILNAEPNRHVISSEADKSLWSVVAHDHSIYTSELVLMSALKQELDLTTCIIRGSKS